MPTHPVIDIDSSDLVEPDALEPWDEAYWINPECPRIYPTSDVPRVVANRRASLFSLPSAAEALLPPDSLSIAEFLNWSYCPSPRQATLPERVYFGRDLCDPNPHAIAKALESRTLFPPIEVVNALDRSFGQAWFNGRTSIIDSYYAPYPLPFWSIAFWRQTDHAHQSRVHWIAAEERIASCKHRKHEIHILVRQVSDRLAGLFQQIGWNMRLCGFPSSGWRPGLIEPISGGASLELTEGSVVGFTGSFLQFFSNGFINDEGINMMLHFLRLRVQRNPSLATRTVIADLSFTNRLLLEHSDSPLIGHQHQLLPRYADLFTNLGRTDLYVIVNPGKDHWAVIKVDFMARTIAYGDSLAGSRRPHHMALSAMERWANLVMPSGPRFTFAPNLPCERQRDGWSCGITSCTLISSSIGIDQPWSCEKAEYMRLVWAERVMKIHAQASHTMLKFGSSDSGDSAPWNHDRPGEVPSTTPTSAEPRRLELTAILNNVPLQPVSPVDDLATSMSVKLALPETKDNAYKSGSDSLSLEALQTNDPAALCVDKDDVLYLSSSDDDCPSSKLPTPKKKTSPMRNPGKHQRSISTISISPVQPKRLALPKNSSDEHTSGPTGISRAARLDRANKEAIAEGNYELTKTERASFLKRLRKHDPEARLDPDDPTGRRVFHSVCKEFIWMGASKRTSKFTRHIKTCNANGGMRKNGKYTKAAAKTAKLDELFARSKEKATATVTTTASVVSSGASQLESDQLALCRTPSPPPMVLCCGLRSEHDKRLCHLFERGSLGGRKSTTMIAKDRFQKAFKDLNEAEKKTVRIAAAATARWIVHHDPHPHVRSSSCQRECDPTMSEITPTDICTSCADLLDLREFRAALDRDPAPEENLKFVPHVNRNKNAGMVFARYVGLADLINQSDSKRSPLMNLVTRTLSGDIKNSDMYMGFMEAMAIKEDKQVRGKGMQNFARKPAFVAFCHRALLLSPQLYRVLQQHFPLPAERNLRLHRSLAPGFPLGISDRTIARAVEYLDRLEYTGPVCISCDDTQLLSRFSPHYDGVTKKWTLLGGVCGAIEIEADESEVEEKILNAVKNNEKATKCRLWCLQVPIPGIPVFILAAMAIGSSLKADDLLELHQKLINGLLESGICVASYSCDGSATERKLVTGFLKSATDSQTTLIPHPEPGFPPVPIVVHRFGATMKPIVTAQDCKHAIKGARNTLYSGTHSMTIGNYIVHYLQVLMLASHPCSPLFQRDVLKVDRQDDRAALRLFSSAFVKHTINVAREQESGVSFKPMSSNKDLPPPEAVLKDSLIGLVAFVFVFGDGFDALQNRSLPIYERIVMVFRLKFFLEIWKASLATLGYPEAQHFVTRDLYSIVNNLVHSFVCLILIYRDTLDHPNYPLCMWLHSTEGCEHTFGEARKIKPDFTYADFVSMIPKLEVTSISAVAAADLDDNLKARASGYHHSLYSVLGIDINAVSTFPPNSLIHRAVETAYYEAKSIFSRCGVPVTPALYPPPKLANNLDETNETNELFIAPAIDEWFRKEECELNDGIWNDDDLASNSDDETPQLTATIEYLLSEAEGRGCAPRELEGLAAAYTAASITLDVEEQRVLDDMADRNELEDQTQIRRNLLGVFPPLGLPRLVLADQVDYQSLAGSGSSGDLELDQLVSIRERNETYMSKKSVRVGNLKYEHSIQPVTDDVTSAGSNLSPHEARSVLVKKIHATLKSMDDAGVTTTGSSRISRIEGRFEARLSGNAANASAAAKQRNTQLLASRVQAFRASSPSIKCSHLLEGAAVTALSPIQVGSYAFVLVEGKVWLGEVCTMYSRGAGKGGKHNWVNKQTNIASLSYVVVKLWENWSGRDFRAVARSTAQHWAHRFAHIPPQRVLHVAAANERPEKLKDECIQVSKTLHGIWNLISNDLPRIEAVVTGLLRRPKHVEDDEVE